MYLDQSENSELNGPESYVKGLLDQSDYSFYPIDKILELSTEDSDDYAEKALRVKDLLEFSGNMKATTDETDSINLMQWEVKTGLKDSRGTLHDLQQNLNALGADIQKRVNEQQA